MALNWSAIVEAKEFLREEPPIPVSIVKCKLVSGIKIRSL
jgi:hypothetical protein